MWYLHLESPSGGGSLASVGKPEQWQYVSQGCKVTLTEAWSLLHLPFYISAWLVSEYLIFVLNTPVISSRYTQLCPHFWVKG